MSRVSITVLGAVAWLALCGSLALVWGSGASRYASGDSPDDPSMFVVGVVLFAVFAVGAFLLRLMGAAPRQDNSLAGLAFMGVTFLAAIVVGVVLDIGN